MEIAKSIAKPSAGKTSRLVPNLLVGVGLIVAYFAVTQLFGGNRYYMQLATLASINIIMATSLNLINGFTGQFSIGHAGFMGVGAYVAAYLTLTYHVPYIGALLIGASASALIGFLVGLPTLRLRGDYLAIATLGFGEIIRVTIINLEFIGGPRGLMGISFYTTFGWAYLFMVLSVVVIVNFINSTHGRACLAIREDEVAAEAMGVNTTGYKVLAFTMGAFFAGLAGGLFGHLLMFLHPDSFGFLRSIDYLLFIVVGGMGSTTGALASAVLLTLLTEALRQVGDLRMIIYSLSLILVMLLRPQGLMGGKELTFQAIQSLLGRRSSREIRGEQSGAS